jgi:pimeloyl-ACP methyl ester carboxylesterase
MTRSPFLMGLCLLVTVCMIPVGLESDVLAKPQSGAGSPQERVGVPSAPAPRVDTMVDVGGRKLHCRVYGDGSPTVTLLSGFECPQDYWNSVIPGLAARTTVVTYDRAGIGRSEIGGRPTHGVQSAKDLRALLDRLGSPKPYILVGHSYGGGVARLFASMYPEDTGGLVLEEIQHEDNFDEMRRILKGKDLETLEEAFAGALAPPDNPRTEGDYRSLTRDQLKRSRPLSSMPFVILTCRNRADAMRPLLSDGAVEEMAKLDAVLMSRLTDSVPGGRQIIVEGTGHNVHLDRPDVLIGPVLEMVQVVRQKQVK